MKLSAYMSEHNLSPELMAARIGDVSPSGVKKWIYGDRTPRPDQMRRIAEVTEGKVTPNDFVLPGEAHPANTRITTVSTTTQEAAA